MIKKVLIAGVGGVLGRQLLDAFLKRSVFVDGFAVSEKEFAGIETKLGRRRTVDVTRPETLKGVCDGVDAVVSVIGITRIKGGLTHMAVDYQGNMNLLAEAKAAGVKKFVFISPAGTDIGARQGVPLMEAKYKFEEALKASGLEWVIVRAGGFMRDFAEMAKMAKTGSMYIIGNGKVVSTPVDVAELAEFMAEDALTCANTYTSIGGPQDMTWNDICSACFAVWGKTPRIVSIPVFLCDMALVCLRPFSMAYYGLGKMIVFFSVTSVPTERRGKTSLKDYLIRYYAQHP